VNEAEKANGKPPGSSSFNLRGEEGDSIGKEEKRVTFFMDRCFTSRKKRSPTSQGRERKVEKTKL